MTRLATVSAILLGYLVSPIVVQAQSSFERYDIAQSVEKGFIMAKKHGITSLKGGMPNHAVAVCLWGHTQADNEKLKDFFGAYN